MEENIKLKELKIFTGERETAPLQILLFLLPFCCGGFFNWMSFPISLYLAIVIGFQMKRNRKFNVCLNDSMVAVLVCFFGYAISVLWAADRGMAAWGGSHFLPILLFMAALMQIRPQNVSSVYRLVPFSGVLMTVVSFILRWIPFTENIVLVNHRLAGFLQYPNTFAAFLLACLCITATEAEEEKEIFRGQKEITYVVLIFGIVESGSRTAEILLVFLLIILAVTGKNKGKKFLLTLLLSAVGAGILEALLGMFTTSVDLERYTVGITESSTLLGRLLYYKDAIPVILQHPLGLGYYGYYASQGSFQTGVYSTVYVHNWLLQILLDIGWIPAVLLVWAFLRSFFRKNTGLRSRLLLLMLLGHGMMDFDLQYPLIWMLILPAMELVSADSFPSAQRGKGSADSLPAGKRGKASANSLPAGKRGKGSANSLPAGKRGKASADPVIIIQRGKVPAGILAAAVLLVTLWLSAGDFAGQMGMTETCLKITPFRTRSVEQQLLMTETAEDMKETADKLLTLNSYSSIAHAALAEVAYSEGSVEEMIEEKELAIERNRYAVDEYRDYFDKMETCYALYVQMGSKSSADYCLQKMQQIASMLEEQEKATSNLAWKIADKPDLTLTEEQQNFLKKIETDDKK